MMSALLLRGLFAGIIAGLLAAGFSYLVGEPPLERALAVEAANTGANAEPKEPEIVSRNVQRSAGLFTAHIIYGAAIGGLFSLTFALCFHRIGDFDPRPLAALLAIAGFVALALVPEIKYPADPPGIGAAETIAARTAAYFALLAISLLAMILAATLAPLLITRLGAFDGALVAAAVFIAVAASAAIALPSVDEVPASFPASVLWNFRIASLGARAVFWGALGLAFGGMAQYALTGRRACRA